MKRVRGQLRTTKCRRDHSSLTDAGLANTHASSASSRATIPWNVRNDAVSDNAA